MTPVSRGDFGGIWKTVSEVDVRAVRREAERRFSIVCVGHPVALYEIDRLLRGCPSRYPLDPTPLLPLSLDQAPQRGADVGKASLVLLTLDSRLRLTPAEEDSIRRLAVTGRPLLTVVLSGQPLPVLAGASTGLFEDEVVRLPDPQQPEALARLGEAVLARLPREVHLAAARRLPCLRPAFARRLTQSVSRTNATVAMASGVPGLVPFLGIPLTAADTAVLTKNQILLVFRLALAYGARPEFQKRMLEIAPVIGAGFAWREVARFLANVIPIWGLVPKVAVAYAGTYIAGATAGRWYENGFVSRDELYRIRDEARRLGGETAAQLVEEGRRAGGMVDRGARAGARAVARAAGRAAGRRRGRTDGGSRR